MNIPISISKSLSIDAIDVTHYSSCLIISDEQIFPLQGKQLQERLSKYISTHVLLLPPGENSKSMESAVRCWNTMHSKGLDRKSLVIGFGGGVITDLAGYVAGCYMRGIDVIYIPTTLLGMVDAAIGGKTGVNLNGKNMIGLFNNPKQVIISTHFLKTLPNRQLSSGLAEVIKYGVISDPSLLDYCEHSMHLILQRNEESLQTIITRSCAIKNQIVLEDPKDTNNRRAILNWGHTFAHAIEAATGYNEFMHGEAVSIGMSCAAHVSKAVGFVDADFIKRQDKICEQAGLPVKLPKVSLDHLIQFMEKDKKAVSGKISLILAKGIGNVCKVDNVDKRLILEALDEKRMKEEG